MNNLYGIFLVGLSETEPLFESEDEEQARKLFNTTIAGCAPDVEVGLKKDGVTLEIKKGTFTTKENYFKTITELYPYLKNRDN